eukprot:CAMPEP_0114242616 /NCGR_PEP_ID=MMETSP0058-20121206/10274_1 /TAXON_ID=36894 /ORGANISM="Pyramimonas parkeae, CCMP726" /LENGTH=72 /DNA_ID=CAMNT_0001355247 /DNA_START=65 /DNA_END=283 /DNA_ORIENTATION=+
MALDGSWVPTKLGEWAYPEWGPDGTVVTFSGTTGSYTVGEATVWNYEVKGEQLIGTATKFSAVHLPHHPSAF